MNYHAQSVADKEVAQAATAYQAKKLAKLMGCQAAERMSGIRRSQFATLSRNSHLAIRS